MPDRILVINPNSTNAVTRAIRDAESETAAFVTACFSDPCLLSAREATAKPVLGMGCAGMPATVPIWKGPSASRWSSRPKPPSRWPSAGSASAGDCART
jgi:Asp/Glu/hydantoin racemase